MGVTQVVLGFLLEIFVPFVAVGSVSMGRDEFRVFLCHHLDLDLIFIFICVTNIHTCARQCSEHFTNINSCRRKWGID